MTDVARPLMPPAPRAEPAHCLDCGAALVGPYCSECGQQARDPDPTFRELVGDAWDAFASVDGRVLASLRLLLLRPGALTDEYLKGRRTRYFAPLRLYLLCSVAYFLASSLAPDKPDVASHRSITVGKDTIDLSSRADSIEKISQRKRRDSTARALLLRRGIAVPPGPLDSATRLMGDSIRLQEQVEALGRTPRWFRRRLVHGVLRLERDNKGFGDDFKAQLPRLMFVLMPVFALLLMLAYRSRRRRFPVHLIVALHLHAFLFAMMTLGVAFDWMPGKAVPTAIATVGMLWCWAYLPLALRRVYGGKLRYAVARSLLVATEYSIIGGLLFAALAFALLLFS